MKRLILLLLPLALVACSSSSPPDQTPAAATTAGAATLANATSTQAGTTGPSGKRTPAMATLSRYHWQLVKATDTGGNRIDALFANPGKPLQLDFHAGQLSVSNTCNTMHGSYQIADGRMEVGPMAQTMKACANRQMMVMDKTVGQILHDSLGMKLDTKAATPRLTLLDFQDDTLVFAGLPTAPTRYGSQGTTVFMEVAAHLVPCQPASGTARQCLKVRERHFDAHGLKTGKPGAWHPLEQPIKGYTHQPGVRNVLRLHRFKVKHAPAGAASTAYVLDMVVASESPGASGAH